MVFKHTLQKKVGYIALALLLAFSLVVAGCSKASTFQDTNETQESVDQQTVPTSLPDESGVTPVDVMVRDDKSEVEQMQDTMEQLIADGTYVDNVSYTYHSGSELVTISVSVENDVVTAASVVGNDANRVSEKYINGVNAALPELVVGKKINELNLPNQISGSSLTTAAFKQHVEDLIEQY